MPNTTPKNPAKKPKKSLKRFFAFPIAPRRQFRGLVISGLAVFLILVGFHVWFFYRLESQTIFEPNTSALPTTPKVNQKKLDSVLARFASKAAAQPGAAALTPTSSDPGM